MKGHQFLRNRYEAAVHPIPEGHIPLSTQTAEDEAVQLLARSPLHKGVWPFSMETCTGPAKN